MQNREACGAFGTWQQIMQDKREQEVKLRRALQKMKNKELAGAFDTWHQQYALSLIHI